MAGKFSEEWGTKCFNTRFPLPTLLYAGYSVKLFIVITCCLPIGYVRSTLCYCVST